MTPVQCPFAVSPWGFVDGYRLTRASDFADEYPDAEVIGTDISPIQPGWVPPNLKL